PSVTVGTTPPGMVGETCPIPDEHPATKVAPSATLVIIRANRIPSPLDLRQSGQSCAGSLAVQGRNRRWPLRRSIRAEPKKEFGRRCGDNRRPSPGIWTGRHHEGGTG